MLIEQKWEDRLHILHRVVVAAVCLFPIAVRAEEPGDATAGLAFAQAHCATCHAVKSSDIKSPNPDSPTFASVAASPGMTGRALAVWLQTSHPTMPNFVIERTDRENVIAYIMSLQPSPAK